VSQQGKCTLPASATCHRPLLRRSTGPARSFFLIQNSNLDSWRLSRWRDRSTPKNTPRLSTSAGAGRPGSHRSGWWLRKRSYRGLEIPACRSRRAADTNRFPVAESFRPHSRKRACPATSDRGQHSRCTPLLSDPPGQWNVVLR
jgi:hypothetical protein